jgi:hypothetical protein
VEDVAELLAGWRRHRRGSNGGRVELCHSTMAAMAKAGAPGAAEVRESEVGRVRESTE